MDDSPIFLLSSERSGSNLMRAIMDAHPRLSSPVPPQIIRVVLPLLSLYGPLDDTSARSLAADMLRVVETQFGTWDDPPAVDEVVQAAGASPTFAGLFNALHDMMARREGKARCFIKDNGVIPHAFALASMFPESKFVYLVRDPRDTALSWKRSTGHPGGVKEAARMWRGEQEAALRFAAAMEGSGRVVLVHYEALTADTEDELRRLCAFLGEDYDDAMLQFHEKTETQRAADTMKGWENLRKPVLADNTGKWREGLSTREIRTVESIAGVQMVQLGYLEGPVPKGGLIPDDFLGKLGRAGRTFLQHLFRGRKAHEEFRRRVRRLRALQGIETARRKEATPWPEDANRKPDHVDD